MREGSAVVVLLAEDDINLGNLLSQMLKKQGIKTKWVKDGKEAYDEVYNDGYDVLILDWMMPELSGIELCRKLREEEYGGNILLLTARDAIEDRVRGLNDGADDYLIKPFDINELVARLYAMCRRHGNYSGKVFEYCGYRLDSNKYTLEYNGKSIEIRSREFNLLKFLMLNHGRVLPRDVILTEIWGIESDVTENNLDVHIRMLRKKISVISDKELIFTVRGVGYCVK